MSVVLRFHALTRGVRRVHGIASALAVCALSQPAQASGPVEAFVQVLLDDSDPQRIVLRYTNTSSRSGLVYSLDGGKTFGLLCSSAAAESALAQPGAPSGSDASDLQRSVTRPLSVAMTGSGTTLLASTRGLLVDDGSGCTWNALAELLGAWVDSVAAHPTQEHLSFAITNGRGEGDNEGLWLRNQDGSATRLGVMPAPPEGFEGSYRGLFVAPQTEGLRLYTTSTRYRVEDDGGYVSLQYVLASDDEGQSFSEHLVPSVSEGAFSLLAVDPTNAARVVAVWARIDDQNRWDHERDTIMVSHDGGETFTEYLEVTEVGDVMFAPDGTLWIGDAGKTTSSELPVGLYRGEAGLVSTPEHLVQDQPITCLGQRADDNVLYLCRRFEFGTFNPADKTFTRLVDTLGVQQFLACDGRNLPKECHEQLCVSGWCGPGHFSKAPFCAAYEEPNCGNHTWLGDDSDAGATVDAGTPLDAGTGSGRVDAGVQPSGPDAGVQPGSSDDGCSVRTVGREGSSLGLSLWGMLLAGLALRRRRGRARTPWRKS